MKFQENISNSSVVSTTEESGKWRPFLRAQFIANRSQKRRSRRGNPVGVAEGTALRCPEDPGGRTRPGGRRHPQAREKRGQAPAARWARAGRGGLRGGHGVQARRSYGPEGRGTRCSHLRQAGPGRAGAPRARTPVRPGDARLRPGNAWAGRGRAATTPKG